MGGNQGGQPMNKRDPNGGQTELGQGSSSEMNEDWNRDQVGQVEDREEGGSTGSRSRTNTPDASPLQDDENGVGTTRSPGSEGSTRY
jgi:hypothetical protein